MKIFFRHRSANQGSVLFVALIISIVIGLSMAGYLSVVAGQQRSVVRSHRGHRLGLLLKADMMRWLADAEPELEQLDTWNMESNTHMIAVNERLGYRVMGREMQFQRRL